MSSDNNLQEPEFTEALLPPGFLRNPVHLLAFGFGSGTAARAPGTWGSLAAIPLWFCFAWLPPVAYWAIVLLAFVVGIWLCGKTAADLKVHDHGGIVWDEFVGMWIALGLFPEHIVGVLLAFVMFRLFDVIKPWPINWLDERLPGHGEPAAELQQRGILLDGTTDGGEPRLLLQIFSANLLGPVFFEFIQRKEDEGFGEGNFKALFESIERDQVARGVVGSKDEQAG